MDTALTTPVARNASTQPPSRTVARASARATDPFRVPRSVLLSVVLLGIAQALSLLAFIVVSSRILESLEPRAVGFAAQEAYRDALWGCAVLGVVGVLLGAFRSLEFTISERAGYLVVRDLRMQMYEHLQRMQPHHLLHRARGGLLLRLTGDLSMLRMWVSRGQLQGSSAAVVLAGGLVGAYVLDWVMASALVAALSLGAVLSLGNGAAMRSATRTMRRRRSLLIGNIDEQINSLAVSQVAGRTGGEYSRLRLQNDSLTRALVRVAVLRGRLRGLSTAAGMVSTSAVVMTGLVRVHAGHIQPTTVLLEVLVARFLTRPVRTLGLMHDYWHRGTVSRQKVLEFLASGSREPAEDRLPALKVRRGEIRFEGVSVPGQLHAFSATAHPGKVVAISGSSGSGATTVLRLVARLVDPSDGAVVIDDQVLTETAPGSIGRVVGMASPELHLMRGSIRRNLGYSARKVPPAEMQRIVLGLGVDETMTRLGPAGVDEWLVEGGANLPFADRQLLVLGRALAGNPAILLLDSPFEGLDPAAKEAARAMVLRHRGTVLWRTTDPQDLVEADEVWRLDGGAAEVITGAEYRRQAWSRTEAGIR